MEQMERVGIRRLFFLMVGLMVAIFLILWLMGKLSFGSFSSMNKDVIVGTWKNKEGGNEPMVIEDRYGTLEMVDHETKIKMKIKFDGKNGFILLGNHVDSIPISYNKKNDELKIEGTGIFIRDTITLNK